MSLPADTIAAISTPPGPGAIGILRLSGPRAVEVAQASFRPLNKMPLSRHRPHELVYGDLLDRDGQPIDRVLCTFSRGPVSYTGEDTAEFQCHGSPMVLSLGLEATVLVTGGDTLLAFMQRIGQDKLIPLGELAPGVVLSQIEYCRKKYAILSKSGGFGSDRLLLDLKDKLSLQECEEEEVC